MHACVQARLPAAVSSINTPRKKRRDRRALGHPVPPDPSGGSCVHAVPSTLTFAGALRACACVRGGSTMPRSDGWAPAAPTGPERAPPARALAAAFCAASHGPCRGTGSGPSKVVGNKRHVSRGETALSRAGRHTRTLNGSTGMVTRMSRSSGILGSCAPSAQKAKTVSVSRPRPAPPP